MYSLIWTPSTGFRRIRSLSTSIMVARGASRSSLGTLWPMPWRRPVRVVVTGVLAEDQPHAPFADDQHPVQALAPGTGDPAFGYRVAPHRQLRLIRMIGTDASG